MITVKNAYHKHGYSGRDHLLDDGELEPMIGLEFRSVAEARKKAESMSTGAGPSRSVPIGIEVLFADGTTNTF